MITITRFQEHVREHPQGSQTLGFADVRISIGAVSLDLFDLTVRLTVEGKPSVSLPRRQYSTEGGTRSRATFRLDLETYEALVQTLFTSKQVKSARKKAA